MLLIFLTLIVGISCSNTNPKPLLTDFLNKIIDGFFDSIRGSRKVKDYQNVSLSWKGIYKILKTRMGLSFLVAVGLFYVTFVMISGLYFIICRCCGRCGSEPPAIDPSKKTNKLAVFGALLLILILCQLLCAFMIQSNNLIIHRKLRSKDKEENWFRNYETVFKKFNRSWDDLHQKINNLTVHSNYLNLADEGIKKCMKKIKSGLEEISKRLSNNRDINELISKAKVAKKTLEDLPKFISNQKKKYDNVSNVIAILKKKTTETITKTKVFTCGFEECYFHVSLYKNLNFMKDKKLKDILEKYYKFLSDDQISKELDDVINIKNRGDSFTKKIINETEQNLKKISKTFLNLIKQQFNSLRNTIDNTVTMCIDYLNMSTTVGNKTQNALLLYDSYRYFWWKIIYLVVILISLIFLIGFLFGVVGKGDERENQCSLKIVGCRIIIVGVWISYFLAPFLMVIVIVFMASFGSIQSEVCQFTVPKTKTSPAFLEFYFIEFAPDEKSNYVIMDWLLIKCKNKSIFEFSLNLTSESMIKALKHYADSTKLNYNFDNITFDKYLKIEEMKKYVNVLRQNIEADISSYVKIIEYYKSHEKEIVGELKFQKKQLESIHDKLSIIIKDTNPLNTALLQTDKTYKILLSNLTDLKKKTNEQILNVIMKNIVTMIRTLITSGLKDLKCNDVHEKFLSIFEFVCRDTLSYLNGSWYGLGLFLILLVPTVIVALFAEMLFRQLQDIPEVELIYEDNELTASGGKLNSKLITARKELRSKALKLKHYVQFRIRNSLKSEGITNKSDGENNQEFTVHFTDLTKKEKDNCYESAIHSLRNYPFKIIMFIENDENVVFNLVALMDENVDSLEWPVPFSMTMMAKTENGVVLWTIAAESNQSGHTCDIDTSKGLYSCDVVTKLSDLGNECFIIVKVV